MNEQIKMDIEKMQAEIEHLKEIGADLFAEEIKNLQIKIDNAKAEMAAAVDQAVDEAKTTEQNFVQKYGAAIARAIEIALLVAVLYKLF